MMVSSKKLMVSAAEQALQSKLKEQSSVKTSTLIGAGFAIALIGLIVLRSK